MISDGEIPAGDYTIPKDITLLVPMDNNYEVSREVPIADEKTYNGGIKQYSCLTMAQGAHLNIASGGAVSIVAKQSAFNSLYIVSTGGPVGNYGRIDMKEGSAIDVLDGGKLFVSGFITGNGEVVAQSGASVYEDCEISDYKAGTATMKLANTKGNKKVFPFGQYHVQNIHPRTKYYAGAKGFAIAAINPSALVQTPVEIIGANGLYQIKNGYIEKSYDPVNDLSYYDVYGDTDINQFSVNISFSSINSADFVLMVTNNTALSVHEGHTLSILHDLQFTPGTQVTIDQGAKLIVGDKARVFALDYDEWNKKGFAQFKDYGPAANWPDKVKTYNQINGLVDAVFDVNGELIVEGQLYTSLSGANIKSSEKTGVATFKTAPKAPSATELYEVTTAEKKDDDNEFYKVIPVTEGKLHNGAPWSSKPEEYLAIAGMKAGSVFNYSAEEDRWVTTHTVTWMNGDTSLKQDKFSSGIVPNYTGNMPSKAATNLVEYEFIGWHTDKTATTALTSLPAVSGDVVYHAIFKEVARKYNVTWMNGNTQLKQEKIAVNQVPAYSDTTPTKVATNLAEYEFIGWNTDAAASIALATPLPSIESNVTYYAIFKEIKKKYPVTWMNGDTQLKQEEVVAGQKPAYSDAAPTKEGNNLVKYEFVGWHTDKNAQEALTTLPSVEGNVTYYAIFREVAKKYTVTYHANGGNGNMEADSVVAGQNATVKKNIFQQKGYQFKEWNTKADGTGVAYQVGASFQVLKDVDLHAQWTKVSAPGGGGMILPPVGQSYNVIPIDNGNHSQGTVTLSAYMATPGQDVAITVAPAVGKEVEEVQVLKTDGGTVPTILRNGVYHFEMPDSDVRVLVKYKNGTHSVSPEVVPSRLNSVDQFAYIYGYPDGTIHPMHEITRAEVAAIFFRLLKEDVRTQALSVEGINSFSDVQAEDWFYEAVSGMSNMDVVKGRSTEIFAPNSAITRAEFATIAARFADKSTDGGMTFNDTRGHWAEASIQQVSGFGWIAGYDDGSFRPDNNITRAEVMAIINRMLLRIPESQGDLLVGMKQWNDNNDPSAWYYLAVQEATNSHSYERVGTIHEKWTALS